MTAPGTVPESVTPSPSQPSASPASQSQRSGMVATVVGGAVCAYALSLAAPLLASTCEDRRWAWGLGALVLIAVPTSARQLIELGKALLKR